MDVDKEIVVQEVQIQMESVAIRHWAGQWNEEGAPVLDHEAGGYVLTFHKGVERAYKAEYYYSIEEIFAKYPQYRWFRPHPEDTNDLILVGF